MPDVHCARRLIYALDPLLGKMLARPAEIGRLLCFKQIRKVSEARRAEKLSGTLRTATFSVKSENAVQGLIERHLRKRGVFCGPLDCSSSKGNGLCVVC
jgi:hypothetical protein